MYLGRVYLKNDMSKTMTVDYRFANLCYGLFYEGCW